MLNRNTYDHSVYHRAVTGRSRRSSFGLLRACLTFTWRLPFNLFRRLRAVYRFARDFDVREFDARWFIPRPADEPELDSYQAGLRFSADVLDGLLTLFFTAAATTVAALAAGQLQIAGLYEPTFPALMWTTVVLLIVFALGFLDLSLLWLPYLRLNQRLTHGSQRWADIPTLVEMGLARRRGKPLEPGALVVGRLSRGYDFVLPFKTVLNGVSIYGPPESGKTTTFFLTMIRALAPTTAMIINDPKREIYRQTANLFEETFRLDLDRPELSDLWNPAPECVRDRELADVMAAAIVDFDPERHRQGNAQFWASAVASVITAGLLRLTEMLPAATLPFLSEFIALRSKEELHDEMDRSKIHEVKVHWGNFSKADPEKTQGNILTSVQTNFRALYTPNARAVLRTPTPEELKRGVREIDFDVLKYPRRAIFITLPEEDDNRYRTLITLFSQLASRSLRHARDAGHTDTPCIFFLDEAGNNAPPDLDRKTAVGRGRLLGHVLGLQTIMQFDTRFGGDKAKSIRDIIGTSIFLPGIGLETARYAADLIGKTTVLSRTSVDVKAGESRDDERLGEAARYLRDPAELRQLVKHQQGVAIVGSAPPILFRFPPRIMLSPRDEARIPRHAVPPDVTLADAERAYKNSLGIADSRPAGEAVSRPGEEHHPVPKEQATPAAAPPTKTKKTGMSDVRVTETPKGKEPDSAPAIPDSTRTEMTASSDSDMSQVQADVSATRAAEEGNREEGKGTPDAENHTTPESSTESQATTGSYFVNCPDDSPAAPHSTLLTNGDDAGRGRHGTDGSVPRPAAGDPSVRHRQPAVNSQSLPPKPLSSRQRNLIMGVCKELKLAPDRICLEVAGGTLDELTTITASPVIDELLRRKEEFYAAGRRAVVDTRAPAVNEGAIKDERL